MPRFCNPARERRRHPFLSLSAATWPLSAAKLIRGPPLRDGPSGCKRLSQAMRQIWISKAGPQEVLQVREAPDPRPAAGEMRIRVEASGVNFADIMGRLGLHPDLPRIPVVPGYEVGGRVDAVGAEVDAGWVGRNVFASTRFGGYADVVFVPQAQVF